MNLGRLTSSCEHMKERRSSGPPYSTTKIRENLFLVSLVGPSLRREGAEKLQPSRAIKTSERGETKRSYKDIQQRDDVRHDVSTVHLLHIPTEGPEGQEVIDKGQSAYRRTRASRSYHNPLERQN